MCCHYGITIGHANMFLLYITGSLYPHGQVSVRNWLMNPELATANSRGEANTV